MTEFVLKRSQPILNQWREIEPNFYFPNHQPSAQQMDADAALNLMMVSHKINVSERIVFTRLRFIHESLRAALLEDLLTHLFPEESTEDKEEDTSIWGKIKLVLLAINGTIYNICNGFDGSVSILSLFAGVPFWIVFVVGLALSFVFVILFYGLEFVSISENLHIRLVHLGQLLDCFHQQALLTQTLLEKIKPDLQTANINWLEISLTSQEAIEPCEEMRWLVLFEKLTIYQEELHQIRNLYLMELNQYYVRLLKGLMIFLAGLLYFNSGFFVGQVFAVVVLSAFVSSSVSLLSWPVMLISCGVGVAALLSVFWFSDRLYVEGLVSRWLGLDIDKIHQLPDDRLIQENREYLGNEKKRLGLNLQHHRRFLLMGQSPSPVEESQPYQRELQLLSPDLSTGCI